MKNNIIQLCIILLLIVTDASGGQSIAVVLLEDAFYVIGSKQELVPTVTSATGKIWMDRNLGASQVATAIDDVASYGDLYQWGRLADGHEKRDPLSSTTTILSPNNVPGHGDFIMTSAFPDDWRDGQNDNLWQGESGINNPCPSGFRLPTLEEWQDEIAQYGITGTALFYSVLRLPAAGYRLISNAVVVHGGIRGGYWSSSAYNNNTWCLGFMLDYNVTSVAAGPRAFGGSVRCIKN